MAGRPRSEPHYALYVAQRGVSVPEKALWVKHVDRRAGEVILTTAQEDALAVGGESAADRLAVWLSKHGAEFDMLYLGRYPRKTK